MFKDGMFYDYKKYECTFWLAQARYVEILSARIFLFKGKLFMFFYRIIPQRLRPEYDCTEFILSVSVYS